MLYGLTLLVFCSILFCFFVCLFVFFVEYILHENIEIYIPLFRRQRFSKPYPFAITAVSLMTLLVGAFPPNESYEMKITKWKWNTTRNLLNYPLRDPLAHRRRDATQFHHSNNNDKIDKLRKRLIRQNNFIFISNLEKIARSLILCILSCDVFEKVDNNRRATIAERNEREN